MQYLKEQEEYIYEKMYDEFKTPNLSYYKVDRWCLNNKDTSNIFDPNIWCISIFDSDIKTGNRVYHIQKWNEPFDVIVDNDTCNIISHKGNCDIKKIQILNKMWLYSNKNMFHHPYKNIMNELWNFFQKLTMI